MKTLSDKSIQTILFDPPYNIQKATWDTVENYTDWLFSCFSSFDRLLKDNGSLFVFHNDMEVIADILVRMRTTRFKFRQMIVWNKRFEGSKHKGFLDGYVCKSLSHNWEKMAEYILFFTFDNHGKLKQRRTELQIDMKTIASEIKSKTGGLTGWYSNIELGKNFPTLTTIQPIKKYLGFSFDDIVPKFRNQKTFHSVWNIDISMRTGHETPKPAELYRQLILHTTDEGDTILDPTAGSFASVFTAHTLKRNAIGIEKDATFYQKALTNECIASSQVTIHSASTERIGNDREQSDLQHSD
jgi:site-specific DNA-methyltransferase (adenine-specific)